MCVWWCEPTRNETLTLTTPPLTPEQPSVRVQTCRIQEGTKGGTVLSGVRPSGVKVFSMRVIFTVALVCLAAGHLFFLFNVYEYGCGTHVGWG